MKGERMIILKWIGAAGASMALGLSLLPAQNLKRPEEQLAAI